MITTINKNDFHDAFHRANRNDNFSFEGLTALFNYLEQLEDDIGEKIELDVIALCCDYSEYRDLAALQTDYSDIETMEDLECNTTVIEIEGSERLIIQSY